VAGARWEDGAVKSLPPVAVAAVVDVVLVVVFVLIGRTSHGEQETTGGFITTFWPFLVGLAGGWAVARAWRRPMSVGHTGLVVWIATVVVGLLLRLATGQGAPFAFVVVASIVLGAFLVGWRVLLAALDRRSTRPSFRRR
jgi:peptidoglycan/LPS O-acetylase OafA/YrhL